MARLPILRYPDSRLYKKASPVKEIDAHIRMLVANMAETMYAAPGIGLAATQVDIHKQVIVIDVSETRDQLLVLINPEITEREGIQNIDEGCLSVPDVYEPVERAQRIAVSALDAQGKAFSLGAEDLLAVCIQHEMDHLEGKVFVDYLSRLKRTRIRAKMLKQQKKSA
ncbi:MAG: peptide deformylase [Betaproteobacteria bacterium RIFCSPLOWO2_02_FULL_62_17]|nr:MAG: peptide deformylase [Betaproteobacteria bacterium RIFCSPLOWO2_02_FULL_62_17]